MQTPSAFRIALLGAIVIAITYGLARFVLGLFLPLIRDDLGLSAIEAGLVGALPFASFIIAIVMAPQLSEWMGPRRAGALTVALATAGLVIIASSPNGMVLALAVALCGISTGLSSPVLADAVSAGVTPALRARVNSVHNAGTSIGVAMALPVSLYLLADWRGAYISFATLSLLVAIAAMIWLPERTATAARAVGYAPYQRVTPIETQSIVTLSSLAAAMGFTSSIYWVFAPDMLVSRGGLEASDTAWVWFAIGIAGLAGGAVGDMIDRFGAKATHTATLGLLSVALLALAQFPELVSIGILSAAAFGMAYMTLTGLYLVQGVRILGSRPALGPVLPFLAIACGQAIGSPLAGWFIDEAGYAPAFLGFAAFGGLATVSGLLVMKKTPQRIP